MDPRNEADSQVGAQAMGNIVNSSAKEGMTARCAIEERIRRLANQQRDLQTLLDMLPTKMTPTQDHAVWCLAIMQR